MSVINLTQRVQGQIPYEYVFNRLFITNDLRHPHGGCRLIRWINNIPANKTGQLNRGVSLVICSEGLGRLILFQNQGIRRRGDLHIP